MIGIFENEIEWGIIDEETAEVLEDIIMEDE